MVDVLTTVPTGSRHGSPWTEEETATARLLLSAGASNGEFLRTLGRTRNAAVSRVQWVDNPNVRDARAERDRRKRRGTRLPPRESAGYVTSPQPTPEMVVDALLRSVAPRTLTSVICGDPPPGYSALDRWRGRRK